MKWWEKTVEYKFIKEYVDIDSFIAPLDGNEKVAGDSIFIQDEEKKFKDFSSAKEYLYTKDNKYILVYREFNNANLVLNARTHFSSISINFNTEFSNRTTSSYILGM